MQSSSLSQPPLCHQEDLHAFEAIFGKTNLDRLEQKLGNGKAVFILALKQMHQVEVFLPPCPFLQLPVLKPARCALCLQAQLSEAELVAFSKVIEVI